jgi:hypothetical protein
MLSAAPGVGARDRGRRTAAHPVRQGADTTVRPPAVRPTRRRSRVRQPVTWHGAFSLPRVDNPIKDYGPIASLDWWLQRFLENVTQLKHKNGSSSAATSIYLCSSIYARLRYSMIATDGSRRQGQSTPFEIAKSTRLAAAVLAGRRLRNSQLSSSEHPLTLSCPRPRLLISD